jgi:hypothetical protein
MSVAKAVIHRSVSNGPFIYEFEVDGTVQTAAINVASAGAAIDAIKALVGALPGTITRIGVTVTLT